LTALLQSRTADFPTGNEEKKPEVISSRAMVSEGKKELLTVPVTNGFESRINSTPIVCSSVGEILMLLLYCSDTCKRFCWFVDSRVIEVVRVCIHMMCVHKHLFVHANLHMHIVTWLYAAVSLVSHLVALHLCFCFT